MVDLDAPVCMVKYALFKVFCNNLDHNSLSKELMDLHPIPILSAGTEKQIFSILKVLQE